MKRLSVALLAILFLSVCSLILPDRLVAQSYCPEPDEFVEQAQRLPVYQSHEVLTSAQVVKANPVINAWPPADQATYTAMVLFRLTDGSHVLVLWMHVFCAPIALTLEQTEELKRVIVGPRA